MPAKGVDQTVRRLEISAHIFQLPSIINQRTIIVQLPSKCLEVSCIEVLRKDLLGENAFDRVQDQQSASPRNDSAT